MELYDIWVVYTTHAPIIFVIIAGAFLIYTGIKEYRK